MPNLSRSPPPLNRSPPNVRTELQQQKMARNLSQSDPDVASAGGQNISTNIMTRSSKRLRIEGSPQSDTNTALSTDTFFASQQELIQMLNSWKFEQDKILSNLVVDMRDLKDKCNEIQITNSDIEKSLDYIHGENEALRNKIKVLEKEKKEDHDRIQILENQLQEIQTSRRSSSVEIKNVPMKQQETTKDLFLTVSKIANTVGLKLIPPDVRDIYRLPAKPGNVKSIVAEFSCVDIKYDFLSKSRTFNRNRDLSDKLNTLNTGLANDSKPIFVDDHIPYYLKRLLHQAKEYAKLNYYEYCWYSNGKILLRKNKGCNKIITIKSDKCLKNLLTQQQENGGNKSIVK
jgi:hypothetical protein